MKLVFGTLFSGSSGNCVYLSYGEDAILIDAGRSARYIAKSLEAVDASPENVRAIFITHEHIDHIEALQALSKKCSCPIYVPRDCMNGFSHFPDHVRFFEGTPELCAGPFTVTPFFTPHDSFGSVGYTVKVQKKKIGVATDMGLVAKSVVEALSGCDAALIECNYDEEMLMSGPYPPMLQARIRGKGGHLSNTEGALLCAILAYTGATDLLLGHLSAENNTPEKAEAAVRAEFEKRGVSARLLVASREKPTILLKEELP